MSFRRAVMGTDPWAHAADLLEASPDALLVVGGDGRIALVTIAAERLFGYSRAELVGAPVHAVLPDLDAARDGFRWTGRHADGTRIPVTVRRSPVALDGEPHTLLNVR